MKNVLLPNNQERKRSLSNSEIFTFDDKRLLIGQINSLFGVQGWVKIFSHTHPRENILFYQPWHINVDANWQTLEIIQGCVQAKTIVAQIKDVFDKEQARAYIGIDLYIKKSQLPQLKSGEYYWDDLIGLEVINKAKIILGKVSNLVDTGSNNVLVINGEREHWVPYISPFLIKVDIDNQIILVDWDENF
ncbi:16S rRNA processing protein RimM [Candidatus Ruthia magnifica str. Cm (Calyptogena magnifica)]|uniref:Ribosome maturation factor RimM n=1 Tax=Ruthia magnifica subsp. Calyptogena magnifica TaxID=413404 RepID=RIMM_RUTMC|nr:ribosome maturation factor RimM [Candidatus Ruthturnera calyptogenae]A1AXN8.1 RecName: Full=Ribosome maturation factor RimM [Candidatus Ruthia magnifica str. Cm (Calyptogena magnifica)]ABL02695.1 16S rRNA processing protein RimM [Candidatus Ruthia magnifica str. Cm (Calyptogena magnifica)]